MPDWFLFGRNKFGLCIESDLCKVCTDVDWWMLCMLEE